MDETIRVFVGSGPERIVEETVLVDSVRRHASRPVDISVIDCGPDHCVRDPQTGAQRPLPDEWRGMLAGGTSFSFARFAPPELCGFEGRVIYLEPDMIVYGDLAELWATDLGDTAFAAVPLAATRGDVPDFVVDGHLSSVMVMDASRCTSMRLPALRAAIDGGELTYADAISLTTHGMEWFRATATDLPVRWNDLDARFSDTALLHFTDGARQPWRDPGHPANGDWRRAYVSCLERGVLDTRTLDAARALGGISRRTRILARTPTPFTAVVDRALQREEQRRRRRSRAQHARLEP